MPKMDEVPHRHCLTLRQETLLAFSAILLPQRPTREQQNSHSHRQCTGAAGAEQGRDDHCEHAVDRLAETGGRCLARCPCTVPTVPSLSVHCPSTVRLHCPFTFLSLSFQGRGIATSTDGAQCRTSPGAPPFQHGPLPKQLFDSLALTPPGPLYNCTSPGGASFTAVSYDSGLKTTVCQVAAPLWRGSPHRFPTSLFASSIQGLLFPSFPQPLKWLHPVPAPGDNLSKPSERRHILCGPGNRRPGQRHDPAVQDR